jgi:hypothetical protein
MAAALRRRTLTGVRACGSVRVPSGLPRGVAAGPPGPGEEYMRERLAYQEFIGNKAFEGAGVGAACLGCCSALLFGLGALVVVVCTEQ